MYALLQKSIPMPVIWSHHPNTPLVLSSAIINNLCNYLQPNGTRSYVYSFITLLSPLSHLSELYADLVVIEMIPDQTSAVFPYFSRHEKRFHNSCTIIQLL